MKHGLMLVAHPDDEILFGGQLLLSTPEVAWDIICVTHGGDIRGADFETAAHTLGRYGATITRASLLGMEDAGSVIPMEMYEEWKRHVMLAVSGWDDYDIVVTHNRLGEYGHPHHMAVYNIAREIWGDDIWSFYTTGPTSIGPQEWLGAGMSLPVSAMKYEAMSLAYPDEVASIRRHMPLFIAAQFTGLEQYTSAGGKWPL